MSDLDDILSARGSLWEALRTGIILLGIGSAAIVGLLMMMLMMLILIASIT